MHLGDGNRNWNNCGIDDEEILSHRVFVLVPEPGEPDPHPEHGHVNTPLSKAHVMTCLPEVCSYLRAMYVMALREL